MFNKSIDPLYIFSLDIFSAFEHFQQMNTIMECVYTFEELFSYIKQIFPRDTLTKCNTSAKLISWRKGVSILFIKWIKLGCLPNHTKMGNILIHTRILRK